MRFLPARCCRHLVQSVVLVKSPIAKSGKACFLAPDPVMLAQVDQQPLFHVTPYVFQGLPAVLKVEVGNPAANGVIDLSNDAIRLNECPPALRKGGDAVDPGASLASADKAVA